MKIRQRLLALLLSFGLAFGLCESGVSMQEVQAQEVAETEEMEKAEVDVQEAGSVEGEIAAGLEGKEIVTLDNEDNSIPVEITNIQVVADEGTEVEDGFLVGGTYHVIVSLKNIGNEKISLTGYRLGAEYRETEIDLEGELNPNETKSYTITGCAVAKAWGDADYWTEIWVTNPPDYENPSATKTYGYPVSAQGEPVPFEFDIQTSIPEKMTSNIDYPYSVKITNMSSEETVKNIYLELISRDDDSAEMEAIPYQKTNKSVNGLSAVEKGWKIDELKPNQTMLIEGNIKFLRGGSKYYGGDAQIYIDVTGYITRQDGETDKVIWDGGEWYGTITECNHSYINTVIKASTSANGSIVKKCTKCGAIASTTPIYYPQTIALSKTDFTYNGKTQIPAVTVTGSDGKVIAPSNYTISYASGCKNIGHYAVKIDFTGNYTGSVTKTFNINPKSTKLSKVKAAKKKVTVKWKKQSKNVKGYQIQYSTNKQFASGVKTKTVNSKKTSVTISKLKSKKNYYVRIRTYQNASGGKCYSAWSATKKVKIK